PEPCRGRQGRPPPCQTSRPRSRSRLTASAQPGIAPCSLAARARLGSSACVPPAAQSQQHRLAARCPRAFASAPSASRGVPDGGSHPPLRPLAPRLARCGYFASRFLPALGITPSEGHDDHALAALVDPCSPCGLNILCPSCC